MLSTPQLIGQLLQQRRNHLPEDRQISFDTRQFPADETHLETFCSLQANFKAERPTLSKPFPKGPLWSDPVKQSWTIEIQLLYSARPSVEVQETAVFYMIFQDC